MGRMQWGGIVPSMALSLFLGFLGARALGAEPAPRVWSSDIHDIDDGALGEGAPAISLLGVRNGTFSGKVVVGSGHLSEALMSDLRESAGGGVIPASASLVRYAVPCVNRATEQRCPPGNDVLLESPPAEVTGKLPVWLTVHVPKDAKVGTYAGELKLAFAGGPPVNVPVKLVVCNWTLPDSQDYRTWVELVQSPDTLSVEYKVPLWSQKHWDLIGKSLDLMSPTGSRVAYVPLIANTDYGNAESMVRWIKKPDGTFDYDFSIMDKYLDTVEKHLGTPKLIVLYTWEVYLKPSRWTPAKSDAKVDPNEPHTAAGIAREKLLGQGPAVTLLDSATGGGGNTSEFRTPRYETPEGKAAWKPLFDALKARIAKRGLEKTLVLGVISDEEPTKPEILALNDISGGLPWASCAHHLNCIVPYKTLGAIDGVPFAYGVAALDFYFNINPAKGGEHYGWDQPLSVQYWRFQYFNAAPKYTYTSYVDVRHAAEIQITGCKRGVGHIGADFWPCLADKRGRRLGWVYNRFPESFWHNLQIEGWMLDPGPDGPVASTRLEVFKEGIQECEARIAIESALRDPGDRAKLGPNLAKAAQDYLDQRLVDIWRGIGVTDDDLKKYDFVTTYRTLYFEIGKRVKVKDGTQWYIHNGWQERDEKLYDFAGQMAGKLAAR